MPCSIFAAPRRPSARPRSGTTRTVSRSIFASRGEGRTALPSSATSTKNRTRRSAWLRWKQRRSAEPPSHETPARRRSSRGSGTLRSPSQCVGRRFDSDSGLCEKPVRTGSGRSLVRSRCSLVGEPTRRVSRPCTSRRGFLHEVFARQVSDSSGRTVLIAGMSQPSWTRPPTTRQTTIASTSNTLPPKLRVWVANATTSSSP